jgi:hypothetical protein
MHGPEFEIGRGDQVCWACSNGSSSMRLSLSVRYSSKARLELVTEFPCPIISPPGA